MKNCIHCGIEIESDDNFCPNCGHWTAKGYTFLKNNESYNVLNGKLVKQHYSMSSLFILMFIFMLLSFGMCMYRGKEILSPFIYIKRQVTSYKYGYNTTILKTDNHYFNEDIFSIESAKEKISLDFTEQHWECKNNIDVDRLEQKLQEDNNIISVSFCDMKLEEVQKVSKVINDVYELFPNIKGYLTNISITNAKEKDSYVAYFQPVYQFVNSINNINDYNKVNKTQILLNSYYFLNDNTLNNPVKENWYVEGASWESLIAHEMGHYVSFVVLLRDRKIENTYFITKDNEKSINDLIEIINNQTYSRQLVNDALNNYNTKYKTKISIDDFALSISNYASKKSSGSDYVYDEIIAEAVHDYYLHRYNANETSLEVINILNLKLS